MATRAENVKWLRPYFEPPGETKVEPPKVANLEWFKKHFEAWAGDLALLEAGAGKHLAAAADDVDGHTRFLQYEYRGCVIGEKFDVGSVESLFQEFLKKGTRPVKIRVDRMRCLDGGIIVTLNMTILLGKTMTARVCMHCGGILPLPRSSL